MKINWGHKLVFFMVLFMAFIVWLVIKMSSQQVDLVDKNYYEKGVKYQVEINKYNAANAINHHITFLKNQLTFELKNTTGIKGIVYFYKPNDATLDFKLPFALNENGTFMFNTSQLTKGNWQVTFEWELHKTLMASQKSILIE